MPEFRGNEWKVHKMFVKLTSSCRKACRTYRPADRQFVIVGDEDRVAAIAQFPDQCRSREPRPAPTGS